MALLPDFPPHYRLLRRPRARRGRHNNGSSGSDSNVMGHPSSESTVFPCGAPPSPSELAVKSSAGLGLVLSLKKIIGEGTTARVVAAREVKTRKAYAIKCIDLTTKSGKCVAENEVGAMKSLGSHPNVVQAVAEFTTDKFMCIVMARAIPLTRLMRKGAIELSIVSRIIADIVQGVDHCHTVGIAHRDIKVDNILLSVSGVAMLADFGLAERVRLQGGPGLQHRYRSRGTPAYCAPCILSDSCWDLKPPDMWSVGVVTFRLLCGRMPFLGPPSCSALEMCENIKKGLFIIPQDVDQVAQNFLYGLLQVNPAYRMTSDQATRHPFLMLARKKG